MPGALGQATSKTTTSAATCPTQGRSKVTNVEQTGQIVCDSFHCTNMNFPHVGQRKETKADGSKEGCGGM